MTCSDCEVNKNIYSFGTCECGNMYSEKLPILVLAVMNLTKKV